jgi:hypothetical protein
MPVNASASRLVRIGTQLVSFGGGVRYWLDSPDSGAEGLGLRFTMTLLFPRQMSSSVDCPAEHTRITREIYAVRK